MGSVTTECRLVTSMINGSRESKKPRLRSVILALSTEYKLQVASSWSQFLVYYYKLLVSFSSLYAYNKHPIYWFVCPVLRLSGEGLLTLSLWLCA